MLVYVFKYDVPPLLCFLFAWEKANTARGPLSFRDQQESETATQAQNM